MTKLLLLQNPSVPSRVSKRLLRRQSTASIFTINNDSKNRFIAQVSSFSTVRTVSLEANNNNNAPNEPASAQSTSSWMKYPHVFNSLQLPNGIVLPNRVLMGSMHTGLEGHSMPLWMSKWIDPKDNPQEPSTRMAKYFQERAIGGVGLMVTGGIAPNYQGWTGPFSSQLTNEKEMIHHRIVTTAVHQVNVPIYNDPNASSTQPSRICLQILHTGRYGYHPFAVSASSTKSPISPFKASGLSKRGIQNTIKDFVKTAVLAEQAGYDGVEIMGSEGYLISQFLSPRTNKRSDEYGGPDFRNRARFPLEIVQQVRAATSPNFIIIFRLSLLDLIEQGLLFTESVELALLLQQAGVTILNTGIGWHESRVPTIATSVPRGAFVFTTKQLRESAGRDLTIPLIATNRINNPVTAESVLRNNYEGADMVSMARPFLADPALLLKSATGIEDEINTCIACNQACLDHVFVGKTASCLVNPRACHEVELVPNLLPKEQQLNLGVVGAGPAGCAFAIAAAQMGHKVTIYDKDTIIGGQFNMAKRIPGKEEFYETLRYFNTMLTKKFSDKVTLQLGTEISHDEIQQNGSSRHDKWIIATGVYPRDPKIPGQETAPNVVSYIDVLKHKKPVGRRVAIIGAGGIGFDVAEYVLHYNGTDKQATDVDMPHFWNEWGIDPSLQHRGGLAEKTKGMPKESSPDRAIFLLQRKKGKLGAGLGKTTGWIHRATLNNSKIVEMLNDVKYERIDENGNLHISRKNGAEQRILEVDTIIVCAGQIENNGLATKSNNSNVYTIGGAYAAGELDAKRAIDMGTRLAYKIHDPTVIPGQHVFHSQPSVEEKFFHLIRRFM